MNNYVIMINFESMKAEQIHESINLNFEIKSPNWKMNPEMSSIEIEFFINIVLSSFNH